MAPCLTAAMSIACLAVFAGSAFGTTTGRIPGQFYRRLYRKTDSEKAFIRYFRIPEHTYYGLTDDTLSAISAAKEAEYVSYTKTLNAALTAAEKLGLTAFSETDIKASTGGRHRIQKNHLALLTEHRRGILRPDGHRMRRPPVFDA